jgi:hypothetical protein
MVWSSRSKPSIPPRAAGSEVVGDDREPGDKVDVDGLRPHEYAFAQRIVFLSPVGFH